MNELIRAGVRRLQAYVPGEQPDDPAIIKLNTNENPYPPTARIAGFLGAYAAGQLRLYPDPLARRLRAGIAAKHHCRPEQVFAGNGSDEVLSLCVRAFVERNGTIGYFDPSYSLYPVLAAIEEIGTAPAPLGPAFDWQLPAQYSADLFFLTCPNAPTGIRYPQEQIRAFVRDFSGIVVIDEAYVDFADEDCADLALSRPNVLVARTLSKSHSLAGIRLGYALGPAGLIAALDKIKDSYNLDRLTQEIGLAAIQDEGHMRANVAAIRATRERSAAALRAMGWEVFPSQANFLWAKPARRPAAETYRRLKERKIFVRYFPGPRTGEHLRISVGTDGQMDAFLAVVGE